MIEPTAYDLSFYRGKTDIRSVQWTDANGDPVDLNGYTAAFTVRDSAGAVLAATGSEITAAITAATGTIVVTITEQASRALPTGVHRYDLWLTPSQNGEYPILYGSFTVLEEVRSLA